MLVYLKDAAFINKYGEHDTVNLLVQTRLGDDMEKAAGALPVHTYVRATLSSGTSGYLGRSRCMMHRRHTDHTASAP